jgi:hypothetical protein
MFPKCIAVLSIVLSSNHALGADFHWKFGIDLKTESVGDKEASFVAGDWTCVVGEPKPDGHGKEMRRLGCSVDGKGLQVYVLPVCYKDKSGAATGDAGILNLQQRKTGSLMVSLTCGS